MVSIKRISLLSLALLVPTIGADNATSRYLEATKSFKVPKSTKTSKASKASKASKLTKTLKAPKTTKACTLIESGVETSKQKPNEEVKLELTSMVDTDTCTYRLSLSFEPNPDYPLLGDPTPDDLQGLAANPDFVPKCIGEGFLQAVGVSPSLTAENHAGLNDFYTNYQFGLDIPSRVQKKIGFKHASLDASLCGTWLQQFPQYSVHFYDVTKKELEKRKCVSSGNYFCSPMEEQCSETGRKFNMDGVGLPRCADGSFQNLPENYIWTIDGLPPPAAPLNAATPAMGLHSIDPAEFAPTRDQRVPYTLYLNYDKEVIGNHVLFWSGFAEGHGTDFVKETPSYNCQTSDKSYYPTRTEVTYLDGRTSVSIEGSLSDCSGPSFTEHSSKSSKKSKRRN